MKGDLYNHAKKMYKKNIFLNIKITKLSISL